MPFAGFPSFYKMRTIVYKSDIIFLAAGIELKAVRYRLHRGHPHVNLRDLFFLLYVTHIVDSIYAKFWYILLSYYNLFAARCNLSPD